MARANCDNIYRIYTYSNAEDRAHGLGYYDALRLRLYTIASGIFTGNRGAMLPTMSRLASIFAVLSPGSDEEGNIKDYRNLLMACSESRPMDSVTVHTWPLNREKAILIIQGNNPEHVVSGPKVRSFWTNIANPMDLSAVTIDGHMHNLWAGKLRPLKESGISTDSQYETIAADFRYMAALLKLKPCDLQAQLWLTWKRLHGIKWDDSKRGRIPQMELFL